MWIIQTTARSSSAASFSSEGAYSQATIPSAGDLFIGATETGSENASSGVTHASGRTVQYSSTQTFSAGTTTDTNGTTVEYQGGAGDPHNGRTVSPAPPAPSSATAPLTLWTTADGTGGSTLSTYGATVTTTESVPTLVTSSTLDSAGHAATTLVTATTSRSLTTPTSSADTRCLDGTYATTTTTANAPGASAVGSAVVFAGSERALLVSASASWTGLSVLADIGTDVGASYALPATSVSATVGIAPTGTFEAVDADTSFSNAPRTDTLLVGGGSATSSVSGLSTPPVELPPASVREPTWTPPTTTTVQAYDFTVGTSSASGVGTGSSQAATLTLDVPTTATFLALAFDSAAPPGGGGEPRQITGNSVQTIVSQGSVTAAVVQGVSSGGLGQLVGQTANTINSVSQSGTTAGNTTTSAVAPAGYSAASFLGVATVLEATFDPAVRCGTDGKFFSVDGPAGTVGYPFWSQVWGGLWMPMTYAAPVTTTCAVRTGASDSPSATYSATFAWTGGSVQMTTRSGTGAQTASGTTQFGLEPAGADARWYSTSRGANPDGVYVAGGAQWSSVPAQLWLGRGIWELTTYASTGSGRSSRLTVTDALSTISVDTVSLVAARPVPAWSCVTADPADLSLVVLTLASS